MKKALCLLLALVLFLPCCAVSLAETLDLDQSGGTVAYPYLGFQFDPPEAYLNTDGIVVMEGPMELSDIVSMVVCSYYAMTAERYAEYTGSHELTIPLDELWIDSLFAVISIGKGMTFSEFNTYSGKPYSDAEMKHVREIGKVGDTTFYLYMEGPNPYFVEDVDPAYRDEYIAMADALDEVVSGFSFFEAEDRPDPCAGLVGSAIRFTSEDLDGNPVSSADLFAQNEITVVNVWATWCDPCIGELEDLQGIQSRFRKNGVGVVGLLVDDDYDAARKLLAEFGVAYPVIRAPDHLENFFPLEGYPTTLFVGQDGTVLSEPVVGARVERYNTILNSLLRERK